MRPCTQKQPQVKKELCRVLDDVDERLVIRQNEDAEKVPIFPIH